MLRPIPYQLSKPADEPAFSGRDGRALSLNISSGGMLVLMEQAPPVDQVLKIFVPTPVAVADTPTLAEVRWARRIPFGKGAGPYLVGLKFIF
ncbi:MAG: PilZ domain-containing protein [Nitrospira sp.]|nr:PilZ domain-containing protein [Nitrospira sp.]